MASQEQRAYEQYLRDIGGYARSQRDSDVVDKRSFREEYGTVLPESVYKEQLGIDKRFQEEATRVQGDITARQSEIDKYVSEGSESLKKYQNPTREDYRTWQTGEGSSPYVQLRTLSGSESEGYQQHEAGFIKLSDLEAIKERDPRWFKNYYAQAAPLAPGRSSITDSGIYERDIFYLPDSLAESLKRDNVDNLYQVANPESWYKPEYYNPDMRVSTLEQEWKGAMADEYTRMYKELEENRQKAQMEIDSAKLNLQGELDFQKETLDNMKKRYAEGVRKRAESLKGVLK